jgi:hypothetical protein
MEWSYHPLIEGTCQYSYKKEWTKQKMFFFKLISSSNTHTWKCISLKNPLIK